MKWPTALRFSLAAAVALLVAATVVSQTMPQDGGMAGEEAGKEAEFRELVRDQATQNVEKSYSLLFDALDVSSSQEEALRSFLIENWIARTTTPYWTAASIDLDERASRIGQIIGEAKLQQFLNYERNLYLYGEVQRIMAMLEQQGVPASNAQRDNLFGILVDARERSKSLSPPLDVARDSAKYLEHRTLQKDEFERIILEHAPAALSPEQFDLLADQYEYMSYKRAYALEQQEREEADSTAADKPAWYSTWGP